MNCNTKYFCDSSCMNLSSIYTNTKSRSIDQSLADSTNDGIRFRIKSSHVLTLGKHNRNSRETTLLPKIVFTFTCFRADFHLSVSSHARGPGQNRRLKECLMSQTSRVGAIISVGAACGSSLGNEPRQAKS